MAANFRTVVVQQVIIWHVDTIVAIEHKSSIFREEYQSRIFSPDTVIHLSDYKMSQRQTLQHTGTVNVKYIDKDQYINKSINI